MKLFSSFIIFVVFLIFIVSIDAARTPPRKSSNKKPTVAQLVDESKLPPLTEVLTDLNMGQRLRDFVRMGISDTRLLVRLKSMDFQIMQMEWDGVTDDDIKSLKKKIEELLVLSKMEEAEPLDPMIEERSKLTYGRLYMDNNIQSFDYAIGSFGSKVPPIGPKKLHVLTTPNIYGCVDYDLMEKISQENVGEYKDTYIVVKRGECSFLRKAQYIKNTFKHASGMIIINNEDIVESPSSGYGIDRTIVEREVRRFDLQENTDFSILMLANSSWPKIEKSISNNNFYGIETNATVVPLQCGNKATNLKPVGINAESVEKLHKMIHGASGSCYPLLKQEYSFAYEIASGNIEVFKHDEVDPFTVSVRPTSPQFDFLSSSVGGVLPNASHGTIVSVAMPLDGCEPLRNREQGEEYKNTAVVVKRGGCSFETKLWNAQQSEALFVIMVDNDADNALQHIGVASGSSRGPYIGIPSVMVTKSTGDYLLSEYERITGVVVTTSDASSGAEVDMAGETTVTTHSPMEVRLYLHDQVLDMGSSPSSVPSIISSRSISQYWLELAHYPWYTDLTDATVSTGNPQNEEYILQLDVLINRFMDLDRSSYYSFNGILNWLNAKKSRA